MATPPSTPGDPKSRLTQHAPDVPPNDDRADTGRGTGVEGGGVVDTPDGERTETRDQLEGLGGSGIPAVDDVRSDVPDDESRENR